MDSDACSTSDVPDSDGGSGDTADADVVNQPETVVVPPCGGKCAAGEFCSVQGGSETCVKQACKDQVFGTNVQKVSVFAYATKGVGCDLDGDGKVDNAWSTALGKLNFLDPVNDKMLSPRRWRAASTYRRGVSPLANAHM